MFQDELSMELNRCRKAISWAEAGLRRAPKGHLLVDSSNGSVKYHWRKEPTDKKGEYLRSDEKMDLIRALAQKDYDEKLLKIAEKEKARIEKVLAKQPQSDALVAIYEELPEARKRLVDPFLLSDEEYAQRWQQMEYAGNSHPFGAYSFFTRRGERVRSKSEVIIADALDAAGVPYRYEQPLHLGGYNPLYPDFTCLNKRTRQEFYWEHMGGMDDADYREGALKKLNNYALAGVFAGEKLLVTYESSASPLDTRVVAATIEHYLK